MREQNSYVLEITQSHDGDGQRSKRIEMQQGQFSTTTETTTI
ncbi:MAG TPA: hypothetical protein VMM84_13820 [Pyrinomonadaceae bacterium]|nr:hypothetical protein [Pyrinomonadaceae bacterium]